MLQFKKSLSLQVNLLSEKVCRLEQKLSVSNELVGHSKKRKAVKSEFEVAAKRQVKYLGSAVEEFDDFLTELPLPFIDNCYDYSF